jgi:WD40 repeat protein
LASSDTDGLVIVWDRSTARRLGILRPEGFIQRLVFPLVFSPDSKILVVANQGRQLTFWDWKEKKRTASMGQVTSPIMAVAMAPDGKLVAAGRGDGLIECWDVVARKSRGVLRDHESAVGGLAFLPDGRQLFSAGSDGSLRMWLQSRDYPAVPPNR